MACCFKYDFYKQAQPLRRSENEYAKLFQKLHACVCINTKPSVSNQANASQLASSYQSNCVTETSKYIMYGSKSRRWLLIKYAKLYLSTEVWICSDVQPSNHTKGEACFHVICHRTAIARFLPVNLQLLALVCTTDAPCTIMPNNAISTSLASC